MIHQTYAFTATYLTTNPEECKTMLKNATFANPEGMEGLPIENTNIWYINRLSDDPYGLIKYRNGKLRYFSIKDRT